MEKVVLAEIVKESKDTDNKASDILIADIDKYVIEMIRISEMYKFEVKLSNKNGIKKSDKTKIQSEKTVDVKNIEEVILSNLAKEPAQKTRKYTPAIKENEDDNISYTFTLERKNNEVNNEDGEYGIKLNLNYQEMADKTGFYQERALTGKVKVQIWPEHLPYDHLKRKRAFLMLS